MKNTKICIFCKKSFSKGNKVSNKQWESRKYCGTECKNKDTSKVEYECKNCKKITIGYKSDKRKYCSKKCMKDFIPKLKRVCKKCNKSFIILESVLKTNASGNFCTRECYNLFLCNTERKSGRGSQWKKIRIKAKNKAPFCAICGTDKKLQVHHIVPFRLTFNNSQKNLIPLCVKCHKKIEMITVDFINAGFTNSQLFIYMSFILRDRQMMTLMKIKEQNVKN